MAHRIEISDNNAVSIYSDEHVEPIIHQPVWPDGRVWTDAIEARKWAEGYVNMLETGEPFSPNAPVF